MKKIYLIAALTATALGGCKKASEYGPVTKRIGDIPGAVTATYDQVADTITLSDGATTIVLTPQNTYDVPGFEGYYVSSGGHNYAVLGVTSSGRGSAGASASPNTALAAIGAEFARIGKTELPDSGTASFTGTYASWIAPSATLDARNLLAGDVSLSANFDNATVNGSVTNRVTVFTSQAFDDITLKSTGIVNGGFSGGTSGGAQTGAGNSATGNYKGLFTGANGQEIVGGVYLTHDIAGTAYQEAGAFIAE